MRNISFEIYCPGAGKVDQALTSHAMIPSGFFAMPPRGGTCPEEPELVYRFSRSCPTGLILAVSVGIVD